MYTFFSLIFSINLYVYWEIRTMSHDPAIENLYAQNSTLFPDA